MSFPNKAGEIDMKSGQSSFLTDLKPISVQPYKTFRTTTSHLRVVSRFVTAKDFYFKQACRLGLVQFGLVWFSSVRSGSVQFGLVQFGSVRSGLVWFGLVWFGLVQLGSVMLG